MTSDSIKWRDNTFAYLSSLEGNKNSLIGNFNMLIDKLYVFEWYKEGYHQ